MPGRRNPLPRGPFYPDPDLARRGTSCATRSGTLPGRIQHTPHTAASPLALPIQLLKLFLPLPQALFADHVEGRYGKLHQQNGKAFHWSTDRQAEVLYPCQLSYQHLRRTYTQLGQTEDPIHVVLGGLNSSVNVSHAPEVFA